jgi:intracellular sulfur oxidation DsrE/DsrF family protein
VWRAIPASPQKTETAQEKAMQAIRQLTLGAMLCLAAAAASAQDRVVYHIDNTAAQGLKGLRNLRNHLDVDALAKITVVTHAEGVDLLMEGAKAANGTEYAPLVSALKSRGVSFEICEITLKNRDLKKEQFIQEASFTPSGVVRIAKLQGQGAAYIKP